MKTWLPSHIQGIVILGRVCIFVDGENFRHSIVKIFNSGEFDGRDYLPKQADWTKFFDWLVERACGSAAQRLRCYWYSLEQVDFYPYRFPNADKETDSLRIVLSKNDNYKSVIANFKNAAKDDEIAWMKEKVSELKLKQQNFLSRFMGWQVVQDGIANRHRAIEFRRAGASTYNLFDGKMGQEKAVDVMLATDMIMLKDIYDIAILVSGDQDYVPAVRRIKDAGKIVVNVAFQTKAGDLLPGGARRLHNLTDSSIAIQYSDLIQFLNLNEKNSN